MSDDDRGRVLRLAWANPRVRQVVAALHDHQVPDGMLASGAVFQSAWNLLCGFPVDEGIGDYDVFLFDADRSVQAERRWAETLSAACPGVPLDVVNQARVHLWYPDTFGQPYPPLGSSEEALHRFLARACAVGVRPDDRGRPELVAPFGVADVLAMHLRPTPLSRGPAHYAAKVAKWSDRWPVTHEPWPLDRSAAAGDPAM